MEEGKLFVHFAPAWRMCRAIRRMLRGAGFNFITGKQSQARAIIQNMLDSVIKLNWPPQADSRNLFKSPAMVNRHSSRGRFSRAMAFVKRASTDRPMRRERAR